MASYQPLVIGLVGPSGGGKTTACTRIQTYGFLKIHAATALKRSFCAMFQVETAYCERPLVDIPAEFLGGVAPRAVLEHLGDTLHRVAPQALPDALDQRLTRMRNMKKPWVLVDGIRRRTETDVIHRHGGKVIRVAGAAIDPNKPCDLTQADAEEDFTVNFAPTAAQLHEQVDAVMRLILSGKNA